MKKYLTIVRTVLLALLVAFVFRSYLFASYIVEGESMEPTLYDGHLLMVNKVVYEWQEIGRQDVIVFHANEKSDYVKRVIGIEGDRLLFKNDRLYINGEVVLEPYLDSFQLNDTERFTNNFTLLEVTDQERVPEDHLFVMGDNRSDSLDSRYFGFVPVDRVVGKVSVRYWPFTQVAFQF